ncbi:MAG TPA: MurT ligase domain-containing protein [Bacillota bacterium]|nr:MurT ligase domain-containing protein [Bacillota bacterium]
MKLRLAAAVLAGKMACWFSRRRGHRGSSLPGLIAMKIFPGCLSDLAAQVRKKIVVVTGTNGKTTTVNMISGFFRDAGFSTVANLEGANMISGVTTSFIMKAGITGKLDCDYAVLEVDEASMPGVVERVSPGVVVVTNFFRDQLDRYWEIDKIIGIIGSSLKKQKNCTLVLNADDPLVAQLGKATSLPAVFFGMEKYDRPDKSNLKIREARFCPFCGSTLKYDCFYYGQLGKYRCPGCRFERPGPKAVALDPGGTGGTIACRLFYNRKEFFLDIQAQGLYSLYNALAAFTVGMLLGFDAEMVLESLGKYRSVLGRMERFVFRGRQVVLSLVKNPAGFNEELEVLLSADGTKNVFIAVNDNDADGRDISWLWDVDFEAIGSAHDSYKCFVCSGSRGEEMALRLKYAGVPANKIFVNRDMRTAVKRVLSGSADRYCFFSTYTALWAVHKIIERMAVKEAADDQSMPSVS